MNSPRTPLAMPRTHPKTRLLVRLAAFRGTGRRARRARRGRLGHGSWAGTRVPGARVVGRALRRARAALRDGWTRLTVFGLGGLIRLPWAGRRRPRLAPRRPWRHRSARLRLPGTRWLLRVRSAMRGLMVGRLELGQARSLVLATALALLTAMLGLVAVHAGPGAASLTAESSGSATVLPVLPVIPMEFDGVPLEAYLSAPAQAGFQRDELLASTVLADPEFARAVHWWVGYWTGPASRWFPGFLDRMALRGTTVDSALATHGFPPSLRYLPLIESGYDPRVTSRTGAVGMWQLMPTTARGLGLQVSPLLDERQHPELSTAAALEYLRTLRGEFDSWFLTLAAYNSGPTRVRGILRRHAPGEPHSDSLFWALRDRFPLETREFVPKLYGAMWVASRPEAYGYGSAQEPGVPLDN